MLKAMYSETFFVCMRSFEKTVCLVGVFVSKDNIMEMKTSHRTEENIFNYISENICKSNIQNTEISLTAQ